MSSSRPVVVHISTVHRWDDSRIFRKMCLSLVRNGYDVTLLAVADTAGEVGGVRVLPVAQSRGRLRRVLVRLPRVVAKAWSMRATIYHLHDPELIPFIPILRLRGSKVIYDSHEDFPRQILEKEYIPEGLRPFIAFLGRFLVVFADRAANHVIAASPKVAEAFRKNRCTVIRNYPEDISETQNASPYDERAHLVVYAGGLTKARGVEQMVDAMEYAALPADWRLLLVGPHSPADFIDRLRDRPGWARVEYRTAVPPMEARRLMSECKIGLAVLQPIGQYVDVLPTKLFEYMSLAIPVVASDYPQCREVVQSSRCGLLVDPTNPQAIGAAIAELAGDTERAKQMGRYGQAEGRRRFTWRSEEQRLLAVYSHLLDEKD